MMFRAEAWGLRERDSNPCLGIAKNPRNNVARFLDADELARLGRALDAREGRWPEAVAAIRLLALTGCRRSEVLDLRWRDIGDHAINLPDSKTGPRAVPLGEAARGSIAALPGGREPEAFLFPRYAEGCGTYSLATSWRAVCADAKLGGLRLHDLRHTAASHAVMSGENLPLVGKLLGHRRHRTTAGYAHLADGTSSKQRRRSGRSLRMRWRMLSTIDPSKRGSDVPVAVSQLHTPMFIARRCRLAPTDRARSRKSNIRSSRRVWASRPSRNDSNRRTTDRRGSASSPSCSDRTPDR